MLISKLKIKITFFFIKSFNKFKKLSFNHETKVFNYYFKFSNFILVTKSETKIIISYHNFVLLERKKLEASGLTK